VNYCRNNFLKICTLFSTLQSHNFTVNILVWTKTSYNRQKSMLLFLVKCTVPTKCNLAETKVLLPQAWRPTRIFPILLRLLDVHMYYSQTRLNYLVFQSFFLMKVISEMHLHTKLDIYLFIGYMLLSKLTPIFQL